jgi:GDP-mannose 6-dehydrogenase
MRVAVYGLGYVGLTAAACLARQGHGVVGIDVNETKVAQVARGRSPIREPGLEDLLAEAVRAGRLHCTTHGAEHLAQCDAALVCVGTPSGPDGAPSLAAVAEVSRQIAGAVDPRRRTPLTVITRSTLRPGTTDELIAPIFRACLRAEGMRAVEIVHNPEFLRESTAIADFLEPPRIVVGTADGGPSAAVAALNRGIDAPVFHTGYREAEFAKLVDNGFHAVKVTFANEMGRLSRQLGVSAARMHEIFVADTRLNISTAYTRPGGAFGGSCLPKDVRALQHLGCDVGAEIHLLEALLRSNESHKRFLYDEVVRDLRPGGSVLLLGLAFKAASDDLRESPKVDLARRLLRGGFRLAIHDPWVAPQQLVGANLGYAYATLPGFSDLLVSADEAASRRFDVAVDASGLAGRLAIDAGRIIDIEALA